MTNLDNGDLVSTASGAGGTGHPGLSSAVSSRSSPTSLQQSRDITLLTKVLIVKAMVFPVVMYGCESWIIKKSEC